MNKKLSIVYMGTPEFAVAPIKLLLEKGYHIAAVVTSPDKPAGRGQLSSQSAVKKFSLLNGLKVLQPESLKDVAFLDELKNLGHDLQIVVAFRKLPEAVWKLAPKGTFNLHASLLPQYRGAAPINWAIINGEKETGVTSFFINQTIDTGNILMKQEVSIAPDDNAGILHDKLMIAGAEVVLETVMAIEDGKIAQIDQDTLISGNEVLKPAPKIYKEDCRINWSGKANAIHNLIRGLSPYPAAFTELSAPDRKKHYLKIFRSEVIYSVHCLAHGSIATDGRSFLHIAVADGFVVLLDIQIAGKKKMPVIEFLRGFPIDNHWEAGSV
jgi:methionyl-tRNA formyltransferase